MMKKFIIPICVCILCLGTQRFSLAQPEPLFASHNSKYEKIRVVQVLFMDTFLLENDEKVQLIGLNDFGTYQRKKLERDEFGFVVKETQPYDSLELRALTFAKNLCEGRFVRLEFDSQKRGPDNILFAYVYLEESGLFINEAILKEGFASLRIQPPNFKHADQLRAAYQEARREQRGIHGE